MILPGDVVLERLGSYFVQKRLNEDEFRARCISSIERAYPSLTIELAGPLAFVVDKGKSSEQQGYLGRIYDIYCREPQALASLVTLYTGSLGDSHLIASGATTIDMIVPILKRKDDLDQWEHKPEPRRGFTQELDIVYAFDLPHSLSYLNTQNAEHLGLTGDTLNDQANSNLSRWFDRVEFTQKDGIMLIQGDRMSVSSMLLSKDFWRSSHFAAWPNVAVIAPDANAVVAFGIHKADDAQRTALAAMEFAQTILAQSLSPLSCEVVLMKSEDTQ